MPLRPRHTRTLQQFDGAMRRYLRAFGAPLERSSNTRARRGPHVAGRLESYWRAASARKRHWDTDRTAAYLAAYVDAFGTHFPGEGMLLTDGYLVADKGVMCA